MLSEGVGIDSAVLQGWFDGLESSKVRVAVPQRGEKRRIVEMAETNARLCLAERALEQPTPGVAELQKALHLPEEPGVIEAFDVSNLGESFAVAGMVRFVNGRPQRSSYRRYKIRSVAGQNDFAMMIEAVERRLARLEKEESPFPDMLLIDGGKGQLSSAQKALARFRDPPMVVSLAKKEETIYSPYAPGPVQLDVTHPGRRLVQRVRDEVHRWAITYHRTIRGKQFRTSSLEKIPGIGPGRARSLLTAFGSIKRLKAASADEIAGVKGFSTDAAEKLRRQLGSLSS
jgi:excinuclease ABC subunit C